MVAVSVTRLAISWHNRGNERQPIHLFELLAIKISGSSTRKRNALVYANGVGIQRYLEVGQRNRHGHIFHISIGATRNGVCYVERNLIGCSWGSPISLLLFIIFLSKENALRPYVDF